MNLKELKEKILYYVKKYYGETPWELEVALSSDGRWIDSTVIWKGKDIGHWSFLDSEVNDDKIKSIALLISLKILEKEEKLKPLPLDFVLKLISLLKITGEWERLKI